MTNRSRRQYTWDKSQLLNVAISIRITAVTKPGQQSEQSKPGMQYQGTSFRITMIPGL